MLKHYLILLSLITAVVDVNAQEVEVKSFEYIQTDLTARTQEKLDANGNACAVVKVDIPLEDVVFKGWVIETVSTPGEYLVYMPEGSTKITMQHKTLTPFTYEFDKPLIGKNTYRLVVLIIRSDPSKPVYTVVEVSDEIKERYNRGVSLLENKSKNEALTLIQEAANVGYAPAQFMLGQLLSDKEAIIWYQKAASQGYADAICSLGDFYMLGKVVSRDAEQAFKYYLEATDLNSSMAMLHTGECFENGKGTPQDMGKAFWYYKKAADLGETSAYAKVAKCYLKGIGTNRNKEEAITWYTKGCEEGDTISCFELGDYYIDQYDYDKAYEMRRKAAENGMAKAQYIMGYESIRNSQEMYQAGNKSAADDYFNDALMWYQKAADQGNKESLDFLNEYKVFKVTLNSAQKGEAKAQYELGLYYLESNSFVAQDIQECIRWLNRAGEQNNLDALIKLGDIYYEGVANYMNSSFSTNEEDAIKFYRKAATLGNFYAQFQLGDLCTNNDNYEEAEKWLLKAASREINDKASESEIGLYKPNKSNISSAQYRLGMLYLIPEFGKSRNEAIRWIRKAAENGDSQAYHWLEVNNK
jgi:hypothetical protein